MINHKAIGGLLQVLYLLLEVLVAIEIDLVELILVDVVFGCVLEVVIGRPVFFLGVSEQQGTFLERESTNLHQFATGFNGFNRLIKEVINDDL